MHSLPGSQTSNHNAAPSSRNAESRPELVELRTEIFVKPRASRRHRRTVAPVIVLLNPILLNKVQSEATACQVSIMPPKKTEGDK